MTSFDACVGLIDHAWVSHPSWGGLIPLCSSLDIAMISFLGGIVKF